MKALITRKLEQDQFATMVEEVPSSFLNENEIVIAVEYSSLNYKDALSAFGKNKVTKSYPHITGIDAAGRVLSDKTKSFKEGEEVMVMGYDFGMNSLGGHATMISVPASWVVRKPQHLSLFETMCLGTAGFTVGLACIKMQPYLLDIKKGHFLITGASGGVGTLATIIFSSMGLEIVAATSKNTSQKKLLSLGAKQIIHSQDIIIDPAKFLSSPKFSGALDTLGGKYLSSILATSHKEACVMSVGLTSSMQLETTVLPFILNGVNLLGINAADTSMSLRINVWDYLQHLSTSILDIIQESVSTISLEKVPDVLHQMLIGNIQGRYVVDLKI